jgi:GTP-binding protein
MKFIDQVIIDVSAGDGGDGCVSFRREKFVPFGGPNGGDGGDGGSIYLISTKGLQTLADLEYKCSYKAKRGQHGMGKNKHGKTADDVLISVPMGTDVFDAEDNRKLGEIIEPNQTLLVVQGGRGGRGNAAFVSSTNRAPRIREMGEMGEKRKLKLILRLIADIGLIGLPNVGKSTLLAKITQAHPKIADYPFTTLAPNLGILKSNFLDARINQIFTIADMPGIIKGASEGKGLGLLFLRHIERTKILIYIIDITQKDPLKDLDVIRNEIEEYNPEILKKEQVVVFNKIDLLKAKKKFSTNLPTFYVSAKTGIGVDKLLELIKGIQ